VTRKPRPYQEAVLVFGVHLDLVALAVVDPQVAARAVLHLPAQVRLDLLAALDLGLALLDVVDDLFPVCAVGSIGPAPPWRNA